MVRKVVGKSPWAETDVERFLLLVVRMLLVVTPQAPSSVFAPSSKGQEPLVAVGSALGFGLARVRALLSPDPLGGSMVPTSRITRTFCLEPNLVCTVVDVLHSVFFRSDYINWSVPVGGHKGQRPICFNP